MVIFLHSLYINKPFFFTKKNALENKETECEKVAGKKTER